MSGLRQIPPRTSDPRQAPPRGTPQKRSDKSRSPLRRSGTKRTPPRTSDPRPTPPRTSEPRPMPPRTSEPRPTPPETKLANIELPKSPSSSAASPFITSSTAKELAQKFCEAKSNTSSSTKSKFAKSPPPSMVKLAGILDSITRADVFVAVEHFGKTKSLLLFRAKQEAVVFFEEEEDAEKLRSMKILRVKEVTLTVIRGKEAGSQQPHEKTSTIVSTTTRKLLLPTPNEPPLQRPSSLHSGDKSPQQVCQTSVHSPDEDSEPVEVEEEEGGPRVTTAEVKAENPADKCSESGAAKSPADASIKAPAHLQQSSSSEPESTARGPETKTSLTAGECSEEKLHQDRAESCRKQTMSGEKKLLLITNLPKYLDGCYSEDDLSELLSPFGFQHSDDNLHVVPQTCMAFASMPTVESLHKVTSASTKDGIIFKGSKLIFQEVANDITATPLRFYKSLMELMRFIVVNDGERIILIKNISWSESKQLRDALEKIGSVKNFLPLLNKVFVEFVSIRDADRLGVWYSFLKRVPDHEVHRLKVPYRACTALPPSLPENALPDSKDAVAGATIPPTGIDVPHGSFTPFWVAMKTRPFLFPTMSPWFIIPEFLTVRKKGRADQKAILGRVKSPTIMLTGLPEGNYKHEDVAKLVWRYFPKQNLNSLYYNVTVLTLQRRAFVFFTDWTSCCSFVQDHLKKPVWVKGCRLSVHFVLKPMSPESSEEMMYTTMMKLSNAGVPKPESLEERLLCVEISETSLDVIKAVVEAVASVATFVSFLPLANRICMEMTESTGVAQVVEEHHTDPLLWKTNVRSKVRHVESLKSLKKRLQDCDEVTVEL